MIFNSSISYRFGVVKRLLLCLVFMPLFGVVEAQEDAFFIRKVYDTALTEGECYDWLRHLVPAPKLRCTVCAG
jgi:carboxypeptidase Q